MTPISRLTSLVAMPKAIKQIRGFAAEAVAHSRLFPSPSANIFAAHGFLTEHTKSLRHVANAIGSYMEGIRIRNVPSHQSEDFRSNDNVLGAVREA